MALGDGSLRTRAASLISASRRNSVGEKKRSGSLRLSRPELPWNEKASTAAGSPGLDKTQSASSGEKGHHTSGGDAVAHDREAQRIVRTIPGRYAALFQA